MYPTEKKRYILLGAAVGAIFLFFVVVMMLTQLRDGEEYARQAATGASITQQTSAARGEIVDATGKAFTGNTTICNITIDSNYFTEQELNPLLLSLMDLCRNYGCEWRDELPITREAPYAFTEDEAALRAEALLNAGIISKTLDGVKVLGNGELTKALNVKVAAYTASAKEKIEKAGGKAEVM